MLMFIVLSKCDEIDFENDKMILIRKFEKCFNSKDQEDVKYHRSTLNIDLVACYTYLLYQLGLHFQK